MSEKELDLALEMIKKWIEEEKKKEMLETIKKWMEEEMKKEKANEKQGNIFAFIVLITGVAAWEAFAARKARGAGTNAKEELNGEKKSENEGEVDTMGK